ncbi:type II secretion system protein [Evansella cellulosilytica]|uniref:Prepilin-type N-terminal cleavage/methylation domain-containing protein n=1 Tax=Evansella cellulosilytica (strain ATCC 21833 / DSM 2522 / FERM P-1141 / JCM 9156 / N-4) TaxID=649639 RepID=E6TWZ2_EVAC2|nr:type II secretion system protein [Evansella cellulosilytica]ADU29942.1 hypothetical protein Bcell_1679 [Evansella cellulosilytica DSM 2522]
MRNGKGYTLVEVMVALTIFSLTAISLIPAIITVQEERKAIRQERVAEHLLQETYYDYFILGEELPQFLELQGITFELFLNQQPQDERLCLQWVGGNGRSYERCLSSIKR